MPIWCDFNCPHASWPDEEGLDGSGSCRTFIAVYCKKYDELVPKNAPCLDAAKSKKQKGSRKKKRKN
jgi:hypothetical protein